MPVTVSEIETILDSRAHGLLVALGMPTVTDGTNAGMIDPIAWGMARIGVYPATGMAITDADLVSATARTVGRAIDYAEYRLLTNMASSDTFADTVVGNGSVMLSQVLSGLERRIDRLGKRLGVSMQPLAGGSIIKRLGPTVSEEFAVVQGPEGSP